MTKEEIRKRMDTAFNVLDDMDAVVISVKDKEYGTVCACQGEVIENCDMILKLLRQNADRLGIDVKVLLGTMIKAVEFSEEADNHIADIMTP